MGKKIITSNPFTLAVIISIFFVGTNINIFATDLLTSKILRPEENKVEWVGEGFKPSFVISNINILDANANEWKVHVVIKDENNNTVFEENTPGVFLAKGTAESPTDVTLVTTETFTPTGTGSYTITVDVNYDFDIDTGNDFKTQSFKVCRKIPNVDVFLDEFGVARITIGEPVPGGVVLGSHSSGTLSINGECTDIETGGIKNIVVIGSSGDDIIDLRGITESDFPNLLDLGAYTVLINSGDGNDKVFGADFVRNEIKGGDGNDELHGGDWEDLIECGRGNDECFGHNGNDIIYGDDGNDIIYGGKGNDGIWGDKGKDNIYGGDGNDGITCDKLDDEINGGTCRDFIEVLDQNTISLGKIKLNKIKAQDTLTVTDESGIDTLDFSEFGSGITLNLDLLDSLQTFNSNEDAIILKGIFEIIMGSVHDDEITISPLADTVRFVDGGEGTDMLNFDALSSEAIDDGLTITTTGFLDVSYLNFETINMQNVTDIIEEEISSLPSKFELQQNYPNPFNPSTRISYQLPKVSEVTIKIFNSVGQEIRTLVNTLENAGYKSVLWNGKDDKNNSVTSGIYFYEIIAGDYRDLRKAVLLK